MAPAGETRGLSPFGQDTPDYREHVLERLRSPKVPGSAVF
jgi:hypothetical protein